MEYPVDIAGFEDRQIVVKGGGFFSGPKLLVDGQPAPKGPKRGQLLLRRNDGTEVIAQLRSTNFIDPIPQIIVDGQTIRIAEPLEWYQWLWAGIPVALVFVGGLLGGLCGGIATVINGRVFRSEMNSLAKYVLTGVVSVVAVIAYFVAAILFNLISQGI